jgi:hypothetical protein
VSKNESESNKPQSDAADEEMTVIEDSVKNSVQ